MCYLAVAIPVTAHAAIELIVPAYGNPCCGGGQQMWRDLVATAEMADVTLNVILNPASGPGGPLIDLNYVDAAGQRGALLGLHEAGARVVGYVHTRYASRPMSEVKQEIDRYYSPSYWRGAGVLVDGIFVDEMSNDLANVGYYRELRDYVTSKDAKATLIGNPGTAYTNDSTNGQAGYSHEDYLNTVDTLITFENAADQYLTANVVRPWQADFPGERFAHLVHSAGNVDQMLAIVSRMKAYDVGMAFVTDDQMPNPYDRLPTFWNTTVMAFVPEPQGATMGLIGLGICCRLRKTRNSKRSA